MKGPELSIILPCYNESLNIPVIVEQIAAFWPKVSFELILVNNGSTDDSARVMEEMQNRFNDFLRIVTIEKNIGYGHGVLMGLKASRAQVLAYTHADIQTPPVDIFRAYALFNGHVSDKKQVLIKGLRIHRRKEEQMLTGGLEKISSFMLGYPLRDINGQPKLFHRNFMDDFSDVPVDFSFDLYVMYKAMQKEMEVVTFPVDFGVRLHGESKWSASPMKKIRTIRGYLNNILKLSLRNISDNRNPIRQFIKFCLVGCFGASVNYGLFYLFYKWFAVHYVVASLCGYFVAAAAIFIFNHQWTFAVKQGRVSRQFIKFIILIIFSFLMNGLSIYLFTEGLHLRAEVSQLITMVITTIINFTGSKSWVFKA